jgi:hypothetical protein
MKKCCSYENYALQTVICNITESVCNDSYTEQKSFVKLEAPLSKNHKILRAFGQLIGRTSKTQDPCTNLVAKVSNLLMKVNKPLLIKLHLTCRSGRKAP